VGLSGKNRCANRVWVEKREASKLTSVGVAVDWTELAQDRK
jgi:hypothetical protein